MYWWQVGKRFIRSEEVREEFVPLLYEQFARHRAPSRHTSLSITTFWVPLGPAGAEPEMRAFGRAREDKFRRSRPVPER